MVSFYPPPAKPIANYTSVQIEMGPEIKARWDVLSSSMLEGAEEEKAFFLNMPEMLQTMATINRESYIHPLVQKLRRESSFDLVVFGWFFNDYQIGLANDFKCPSVIVASMNAVKPLLDLVGNPNGVAFTPMPMATFTSPMNFKYRFFNFVLTMFSSAITEAITYFHFEPEFRRNFPPEQSYPSFDEAKKNVALVLVSSHFSQNGPTVNFPSLVEVSGMHIKKNADPLPEVSFALRFVFFTTSLFYSIENSTLA